MILHYCTRNSDFVLTEDVKQCLKEQNIREREALLYEQSRYTKLVTIITYPNHKIKTTQSN